MKNIIVLKIFIFSLLFLLSQIVLGQQVPTSFRGKALSTESINITWNGVADSFTILRSMDGNIFTELTTVDGSVLSFTDNGLSASTPYLYKLYANVNDVKSANTAALGIATKPLTKLPNITNDISGSLTVQYENSSNNENSRKLIDNDVSTKFLFYSPSGWMIYYFPQGATVKQYAISSANDAPERDPKSWTLEASNDNSGWQLLDSRTNQKFAGRYSKLHFAISNSSSYKYYRLTITQNNGSATMTQLAEWSLMADCNVIRNTNSPSVPGSFSSLSQRSANGLEQIMPSSNQIILNWLDNSTNEDYYVLERSTNQSDWNWSMQIPKNNTRYRSLDLSPSTTYYYRLKAVNDIGTSAYTNIVSATTKSATPPDSIVEDWDVHRTTLYLQYHDDQVAIYYDKDVDPTITWPRTVFGGIWSYLKQLYGSYSDPLLYVYFHAGKYSGGHPSTWSRADHHYRNILDLGTNTTTATAWQSFGGNNLDLPVHEIGHIMEGASLQIHGSPERVIWGDSKYAEIFNYDVYINNNLPEQAKRWYDMQMGNSDSTTPRTGIYWFRDFYYPIYSQYGGKNLLANFFVQMAKYLPQRNGDYTRDMNWGEFIHFYSIAAGVNLKPQATVAFGWTDEWETQFVKAQADFPADYLMPPVNIMDNGQSEVNFESTTIAENSAKLFDKNYSTNYIADRTSSPTTPFAIIIKGLEPTLLKEYSLVSADNSLQTSQYDPTDWKLYGANNLIDWEQIDNKTAQLFAARKEKKSLQLTINKAYKNYKLEISKMRNTSIKKLYLAEFELKGSVVEVPTELRTINQHQPNLNELVRMVDSHPHNRLRVVGIDGKELYNSTIDSNAWLTMLNGSGMTKGIYVYSLSLSAEMPVYRGKMIVR